MIYQTIITKMSRVKNEIYCQNSLMGPIVLHGLKYWRMV